MNLTAVELRGSLSTATLQHRQREQRVCWVVACFRPCSARQTLQRRAAVDHTFILRQKLSGSDGFPEKEKL